MIDLWPRLEQQLAAQYPDVLASLRPPATPAEIVEFEVATRQTLPADIRTAYLLHDGCMSRDIERGDPNPRSLLEKFGWASLEFMLQQWRLDQDLFEEFADEPYSYTESEDPSWYECEFRPWIAPPPCWLPIGIHRGDHQSRMYVDLLPGPRGIIGQLVINKVATPKRLISTSFESYLEALTIGLERGELDYNHEHQFWYFKATGASLMTR
jgi:cell wall assembly regulator SMI1